MKITKLSYRENRASPENKFLHRHVELEAELSGKDTPETVLDALKAKARDLLYPELSGLQDRIKAMSPLVGSVTAKLSSAQLAELYLTHEEEFTQLLSGNYGPKQFIEDVLT